MSLSKVEQGYFLRLFNRGGYVLDFTTSDFDTFTMESVGVALVAHYHLSKGKSLNAFVQEASSNDVDRLLLDLFEYYEAHCADELEEGSLYLTKEECRKYYDRCQPIATRERANLVPSIQKKNLEQRFTSEYMHLQIDTLFASRESNPTEAIGKAKELVESCCKTILLENSIEPSKNWTVSQLIKGTMAALEIAAPDINEGQKAGGTIKQILGGLSSVAGGIAELRNPYGTGHGKDDGFRGLSARHSKLAVGASVTLVEYLWDAHEWRKGTKELGA
ncbi:abortive infection family protein [Collinsella sp. D33t1_170424_A12]|uniref:abortive infection family protein n=1 Tax=Collinsella sp. D33t1_170424_A12 TaxID=2787135 RepID=UPI00189AD319|nr:abortive infection family protein [Collinsella sp. D33t1_170424_A12]